MIFPMLQLPDEWIVGFCVVGWVAWSLLVGFLGHRLPLKLLETDTWLTRPRPWGEDRLWYVRVLRIKRWKDRLPEAGSFFKGGFCKRSVGDGNVSLIYRFLAETRRAEYVHFAIWLFWLVTMLWTPGWGVLVNLAVGTAFNLPCLWVQRYNRLRLQRTLVLIRLQKGAEQETVLSQNRQAALNHLAAIVTIIRLVKELDERTLEGKRYWFKVNADYETVEMYALDGRGLILYQKDGQISGRLLPEDVQSMEQLSQQLDRQQTQRQVERCMPVLFKRLQWLGQYQEETTTCLISYEPATRILTYQDQQNLSEFLIAQRTQQGWEYLEGRLALEQEKAITVDLANFLRQQEQA